MAVTCKKCGDGHPTWECPWSDEKAAKRLASKFQAPDTGHIAGATRIEPKPVGQAVAPPNSRAKATKGKTATARAEKKGKATADGVASRPIGGGGTPELVTIVHHRVHDLSPEGLKAVAEGLAKKRGRPIKANPKSPRAAYMRDLMRRKRAEAKPK